jgi:uncharacterized damage-inducible protein DinB
VKEILQRLASYNVWANKRLAEITLTLPESILTQHVIGSFPSVRATILHMADAESIWWQRIRLDKKIERPSDHFTGNTVNAFEILADQNNSWKSWVERAGITELTGLFTYRTFSNEEFTQPVCDVLMHIFNHGSYHRGQWVNQLRECGIERLPATDFVVYSRQLT